MIYFIILLLLIIGVLVFVILNLLKKQERMEDVIISYQEYITKFTDAVNESDKLLNKVDEKGTFKSDDEVGFFFTFIKKIQSELNTFKIDL
jgi:uncharacterized membrane protein (DUF106 family)